MVVLSFLILFMPALALPEEVISVNELYNQAVAQFCGLNFLVLKDSRGIVLRYFFDDINNLKDFYRFLKKIELFLAKIKQLRGGACIKCGYNKCIKALEFHHIDPAQKDFTISNDHFKLKDAVEESKKCVLLCSNCHKELHDNMWTLDELDN